MSPTSAQFLPDPTRNLAQHPLILHLEDQDLDAKLILAELHGICPHFHVIRARDRASFENALAQETPDLILSDYSLPGFDGFSALQLAKDRCPEVPFIFVSGAIGEDRAIDALRAGLTDYVLKDRLQRLAPAVQRALAEQAERQARRRAVDSLRDSEERFRATFEQAAVGIAHVALDGRWIRVNQKLCDILGYTRDELIHKTFQELTHPDDLELDLQKRRELVAGLATQQALEKRYFRKDHSIVWTNLTVSLMRSAGEPKYFITVIEEITARKQAEDNLRRRERELRTLAENTPDLLTRLNRSLHLVYVNRAVERITGSPCEAFLGKPLSIFGLNDAQCHDWITKIQRVFATAQPETCDLSLLSPLGLRHFQSRIVPEFAPDGAVDFVLAVTHDVTSDALAKTELEHAKNIAEAANKAKDRFLAALSHELRTPLTPVLLTTYALEADPNLSLHYKHDIQLIRRHVELEARLIDDLLDLTRIARGKLELHAEAVDIHSLLHHALQTCRASDIEPKNIRVHLHLAAAQHIAWADAPRLEQAFWNLLKNAAKFTAPGGAITLSTANDSRHNLIIQIADNGMGIEPHALPHIFDAFEQGGVEVTREFGGLGLGLAIAKAVVDLHQGTITAASPGKAQGSTFTITLATAAPLPKPTFSSAPAPHFTALTPPEPLRILLVEDHESTRQVMTRLLRALHHEVHTATCISDALLLSQRESFDLLLSDLGLPDGSGHDLMHQIRKHSPLKAIALSGYGMEEDIRKSREAGFADHLTKPVNFDTLQQTITRVMNAPLTP